VSGVITIYDDQCVILNDRPRPGSAAPTTFGHQMCGDNIEVRRRQIGVALPIAACNGMSSGISARPEPDGQSSTNPGAL
jgi:hypothetical protein